MRATAPNIPKPLDSLLCHAMLTKNTVSRLSMESAIHLPSSTRLLDQLREVLRYKHYSLKTEQAYVYWVRFFVRWCDHAG